MITWDEKGRRITLVDDIPENIKVIGAILRNNGFLISIAQNGREAIRVIEQNPPDLILMDIIMPEMDGLTACRYLKNNPATKDIPVIFLSARTETIDKVEGFKAGAVDYVTKPVEAEELLARIKTHLTIKSLYRKLEEANDNLEEKIRLRTRDLVKKKQALEEEVETRKEKEFIIKSSSSAITTTDLNGVINYINPAFMKIWKVGYEKEVLGHHFSKFFRVKDQGDEIVQTLKSGGSWTGELMAENCDRNLFNIEVFANTVVNSAGEPICLMFSSTDITERKLLEEAMIQSEKMMSVGGLAAGMAHEINNPLAGIIQNIQIIQARIRNSHPKNRLVAGECGTTMEAIEAYMEKRGIFASIDMVKESGHRATCIVRDMLNFSRKSESNFKLHKLCELVDKTVELAGTSYDLEKKYDFQQIKVVRDYNGSVPEIVCEGPQIQQVILNILKNGMEAMAEKAKGLETTQGGEKYIPCFIIRIKKDDQTARIEIEDNGPGMDEATRKKVFEPFFTTRDVGKGTGLGLSVSYFIVTSKHNGTISVESAPEKGTRFIITLPVTRP